MAGKTRFIEFITVCKFNIINFNNKLKTNYYCLMAVSKYG